MEFEHEKQKKSTFSEWILTLAKVVFSTWLGFSLILVLILGKYSFWVQRSILFLQFVRWPLKSNLRTPSNCGLTGGHNFYVESTNGVKLGAWHILPALLVDKIPEDEKQPFFEQSLGNGLPIVLYMHGNTGTRATFHRVELYKIFQKLNFHVITFDYRSYGDSSDVLPDEVGVVDDAKSIIRWLLLRKNNSPVYVWGHSLGTAIAAHAMYDLEKNDDVRLDGLILECPFNNLRDEITFHPISRVLRHMIGFKYFVVDPIIKNGISFKTDEYIAGISAKVLILTAEDDWIIPYTLSYKLFKYAVQHRPNNDQTIKYVQFNSKNRYGHKYICHSDDLPKIVRQFTSGQLDAISSKAT